MRILRPLVLLFALFASLRVLPAATIFNANGEIDPTQYAAEVFDWSAAAVNERFGPAWVQRSSKNIDTRPLLYKPPSNTKEGTFARINPWELGTQPSADNDYWSDSGQVGYVPDDPKDQGLARVALYAYYSKVFALSPRLDYASGRPTPDAHARDSTYVALNGEAPMQPVAMARGTGMTQNEALVIYRDGMLGIAGTQTSRKGIDRPFPGFKFPEHKVPTGIAITTQNEFAVVTIWDTDAMKGQLAVIALEGKHLPFHTMPHMGLVNQGSWSAFKLLGYIDLPMAAPSSVSAASNGYWNGPSQTGGKGLGAIKLSDDETRAKLKTNRLVATGGYAIVASKQEGKAAIVDLTPLFQYMRRSYLESAEALEETIEARGPAAWQFPRTFAVNPAIRPSVIWQGSFADPTAVLAGHRIDRWSKDLHKAYIATEKGTIHIIDTSPIMWRSSWEVKGDLGEIGTFNVGANPVGMTFARRAEQDLPLIPKNSNSGFADCFNSVFWVAVRGEAAVKAVHTYHGRGQVHLTIRDRRMSDPVAVSTAVRGPILTVADFSGKKILSFRIGPINDVRNKVVYGAGKDGDDAFEFAGELALPGHPFLIGSANVN